MCCYYCLCFLSACCVGILKGPSIEGALFSWESSKKKPEKQQGNKQQTVSSKEEEFFSNFNIPANPRSSNSSSSKAKVAASPVLGKTEVYRVEQKDEAGEPPSEPSSALISVKQPAATLDADADSKSPSILGKKKSELRYLNGCLCATCFTRDVSRPRDAETFWRYFAT